MSIQSKLPALSGVIGAFALVATIVSGAHASCYPVAGLKPRIVPASFTLAMSDVSAFGTN